VVTEGQNAGAKLLELANISKTFPGQRALDDLSVTLNSGEICALIGQNGSGKSTLVKILAGFHEADPGGTVTFRGHTASVDDRHGEGAQWRDHVRFIHQELGLVESLGALDNLALGSGFTTGFGGRIRWRRERAAARELFNDFGLDFDLDAPVATLSGVERTMIAVARALRGFEGAEGLLILDEPTASLPISEVEVLFDAVRRLVARGAGVLFVSHRLEEVMGLADRVIALREGRLVGDRPAAGLDHDALIEMIIGRSLDALYPSERADFGEVRLRARGLVGKRVDGVDLEVRAGEILGIAGLNSSGREEIADLLFGLGEEEAEEIAIDGEPVHLSGPAAAMRQGIALVPSNRVRRGMIGLHSVRENVTLPALGPVVRAGVINRSEERDDVLDWCTRVSLDPMAIERPLAQFSGGNQQKVVIAKWLRRAPRVLLLDEPTQGVDIGAKAAVYHLIVEAAAGGTAIVLCSSDNEELAELCDRVIVLTDGRTSAELRRSQLNVDRLTQVTLRADPQPTSDLPMEQMPS
jgi:ribose transport system ATP-binding protein